MSVHKTDVYEYVCQRLQVAGKYSVINPAIDRSGVLGFFAGSVDSEKAISNSFCIRL
jgi:hypothetical protein